MVGFDPSHPVSLYIHIPFCRTKCDYCAFYSRCPKEGEVNKYLELLLVELEAVKKEINTPFYTIFIGGGNPGILGYERIKRIIQGYTNQKGYNVQGIEANLKYYKVKYIDRFNREDDGYYIVNELSKYTKELAQLEHGLDLQAGELQILFSDEDVDKFTQNEEAVSKCKIIYLDNNALITEEQLKLFEQNDIKICYIPDYYFEKEIMEVEQW